MAELLSSTINVKYAYEETSEFTLGISFNICKPSPGPICVTWLKFDGPEISFDTKSASSALRLSLVLNDRRFLLAFNRSIAATARLPCFDFTINSSRVTKIDKNNDHNVEIMTR